jgi:hypothetical protein
VAINPPLAEVVPMRPRPPAPPSPRLALLLSTQAEASSLGTLAGLVRPLVLDKTFNVGPASGAVGPVFVATADVPGREEIGLLGPVTVRLSAQRLVTISIQTDSAPLVNEQRASGGLKLVAGWAPFDTQAAVSVTNPSASFYVVGQVYAPVWYMRRSLFDAIQRELRLVLPPTNAEATGVV